MIEKIEKLLSDYLDKLSDELKPIELKDKILSDIEKISVDIINHKKIICDIVDLLNLEKISDDDLSFNSFCKLKFAITDLQSIIDDLSDFIKSNKNKK